jgi:hypothetical protein
MWGQGRNSAREHIQISDRWGRDGTAPGNLVRYQIGKDRDGTAPGKLVRYQIGKIGKESSLVLFHP